MKKLYWTYRMAYTNDGDRYSISYYLDKELEDYKMAGIVGIEDMTIPDEKYTAELAPWLKNKTRFFKAWYNDTYVSDEQYEIVKNKMKTHHYALFFESLDDAKWRIESHTSLVKKDDGETYVITEAYEEDGEQFPETTLVIN